MSSTSKPWSKTPAARRVFSTARWLHVYISSLLLLLLIFFSVTGITLNHSEWFSGGAEEKTQELKLPQALQITLAGDLNAGLTPLQQWLKQQTGLQQPNQTELDYDAGEIYFDYSLPAGYAYISVIAEDGLVSIESRKGNLVGLLNDLHKGRHSGIAWSWLIDISAVLMLLFGISGLIILLQNKKYRKPGLTAVVIGTILPLFIYLFWVPQTP